MTAVARPNGDTSVANPMSLCSVCQEVSDNHHLHYGALCCFSCRAFFRRANQTVGKVYVCKQDGKCDVSKKNRKKCQKCRYEACLRVGMDPALVLTEDQKKARFRKMLEKKNEPKIPGMPGPPMTPRPNIDVTRRPMFQTQRSAPPSSSETSSSPSSKAQRDESFTSVKRRRTTPPGWTTSANDVYGNVIGDDGNVETEELIRNEEFASANLENLERLLSIGDLQTDTLQEVEATLNLIQGTKRCSEIAYYPQQQQHQQQLPQQQQPEVQSYQLQPRSGPRGFFPAANQGDFYPADPFEPVCSIKQEAEDEEQHQHQLHQMTSSTMYLTGNDTYLNPTADAFLENLQNYFDGSKLDDLIKPKVDVDPLRRIMTDFDRCASSTLAQESDLVRTLLNFHCSSGRISKFDARRLITCLAEIFRQFAMTQTAFQALSGGDQFRLLAVTRPLFVHYILGQYFVNSSNGLFQLQWLIGEEKLTGCNMSGAVAKSIREFNDEVGLFLRKSSAERYLATALKGLSTLKVSPRHNGLVAAVLLYSPNSSSLTSLGTFDNFGAVDANENVLLKMLRHSRYGELLCVTSQLSATTTPSSIDASLSVSFVDVLHVLRDIFMEQVIPEDDKKCNPTPAAIAISSASSTSTSTSTLTSTSSRNDAVQPATTGDVTSDAKAVKNLKKSNSWLFTEDETDSPLSSDDEEILSRQIGRFQSNYRQISLGEDFVKEFVMFSYDVPLSKHFATRAYNTFADRFKKILQVHPGFDELTETDQNAIWKEGCAKAAACCFSKIACCQTGNEQLEFLFGESDRNQWRENYESSVTESKVAKIKKIQMSDCNRVSAVLTTEEMMDYLRLVGSLGEVTTDEDVFKILVLLSLFSGDDLPESTERFVSDMRNGYMKILRRKLRTDRRTFSKIVVSLADIDELARIMKKLEINESDLRKETLAAGEIRNNF